VTDLVCRFVLPARLAPTFNSYSRMHWSRRTKLKKECLTRMLAQAGRIRSRPLDGKPTVLFVRWTSSKPDDDAAYTKVPLDCLKAKGGLGLIADDSPDHVTVRCAWEKNASNVCIVEVHEDGDVAEFERSRGWR
jgi:hypothetical protein